MHWHRAIHEFAVANTPYVIASVLATTGSAPRGAASKMVIAANQQHDTIGGGQLEALVIERARELLGQHHTQQTIEHFPLAASAAQCCGGSVTVLFECFAQTPLEVTVFGAGHVGSRVMHLLGELNANARWIDSREQLPTFNELTVRTQLEHLPEPVAAVKELPPSCHVVIVTHDHALDFDLISALLQRARDISQPEPPDALIGLIGSTTKWQRFSQRLLRDGFTQAEVDRVNCPIGDPRINHKEPMAVAISIVTQLLQQPRTETTADAPDALSWRQVKNALVRESS